MKFVLKLFKYAEFKHIDFKTFSSMNIVLSACNPVTTNYFAISLPLNIIQFLFVFVKYSIQKSTEKIKIWQINK